MRVESGTNEGKGRGVYVRVTVCTPEKSCLMYVNVDFLTTYALYLRGQLFCVMLGCSKSD